LEKCAIGTFRLPACASSWVFWVVFLEATNIDEIANQNELP